MQRFHHVNLWGINPLCWHWSILQGSLEWNFTLPWKLWVSRIECLNLGSFPGCWNLEPQQQFLGDRAWDCHWCPSSSACWSLHRSVLCIETADFYLLRSIWSLWWVQTWWTLNVKLFNNGSCRAVPKKFRSDWLITEHAEEEPSSALQPPWIQR